MTDSTANPPAPQQAPVLALPPIKVAGFLLAAVLIALGAGLGQGFVSANLPQIAGDLGVTTTEASWLVAAYIIPRCCLPILLIKIRTQYGLRRFTEWSVVLYVLVNFAAIWMNDLRSALVVEVLSGAASASLSTLAFLYIMEPMTQKMRIVLGLPMALTFLVMGPSLARVISPALIGDGGLMRIHALALGMALASLALVLRLPLTPVPHEKVIRPLDFLSFGLITGGFSGVIIAFIMGPIRWWTDAPWLGWLLAAGIAALALAMVIELRRAAPLLDVRWLMSPAMVHLTGALLLFRIILSEQSTGAPRMFLSLGVAPSQMVALFAVICIATFLGGLACFGWMRPGREPYMHLVALLLIAAGAWMDSLATIDTRPEQMLLSQAMIALAGMIFMPPAMMAGLLSALRKGPQYILSFIIIYISTQSIGGMLGSGVFTSLINHRQAFHWQQLQEELVATSGPMARELTARMAALSPQIADTVQLKAQAMAQIATNAQMQATVMAYNDAYFLTFLLALGAAALLVLHLFRDWLMLRLAARRLAVRNRTPDPDPQA